MLFLIYINDLATISKQAITILFADDTNTIYKSNSYDALQKIISDDLQIISDWFRANKMALNETKTKFIIFHNSYNKPPPKFTIILNDTELERVEHTKFLGVLIQENLSWKTHIDHVSSRVSKATAILAKLKHYLPKYVLTIIFNSLCSSHISYALPVWRSSPKTITNRINKLQKKGIRHVCNTKYNAHTEPLFKKEKILKFDDLFKAQCTKLMYKKMQHRLHQYHTTQLTTNYECNHLITRQRFDVHIRIHKNRFSKINAINFKVGQSWNELPFETKMLAFKSMPTFTKNVKNTYLNKYSYECTIDKCHVCKK